MHDTKTTDIDCACDEPKCKRTVAWNPHNRHLVIYTNNENPIEDDDPTILSVRLCKAGRLELAVALLTGLDDNGVRLIEDAVEKIMSTTHDFSRGLVRTRQARLIRLSLVRGYVQDEGHRSAVCECEGFRI